ncbi:MotA/TolQ/ExbB proton channel family protein [Oscillibacter sp.]|jgi:chemotaxis protein MotA|uniref:motility protein A n=3 Tax=Oscillibacter TaxID=459786 RepID=UPI00216DB81D|nr:MotA/TolQ/ExbB proton channel family protein [Oscillibacter sp.]MCI9012131.1 motility protein A [Oscillibacter sp.]MCI9113614.1 motility protein A [Oscillibacter sp.]MCI9239958.1 motility protein A [Oscillibacter sp.]
MNINYIIGIVGAFGVFLLGCVMGINIGPKAAGKPPITFELSNLWNFFDAASIFITIGCTIFIVVASFPGSMLKAMPKHFKIILNNKMFDPKGYIDQLVELAQIARKNGLLSLEEKANEQTDPFFKQAIMLIVDANDQDKVRGILENDIECMSARHEDAAALYDKASSVAPAFGMVGTLVGLINMLMSMNLSGDGGADSLGTSMGTAMITTLYGCLLAHVIFGPVAQLLRGRDSEEVLCKQIIVEGVMAIQAGENPKSLRERLLTYMSQKQREMGGEGAGGGEAK